MTPEQATVESRGSLRPCSMTTIYGVIPFNCDPSHFLLPRSPGADPTFDSDLFRRVSGKEVLVEIGHVKTSKKDSSE